ncbi:hypothetical protein [Nocardia lijiangensis]|uniref:hypothetical protein n=1 Tax=Nocardia lijiangensis TaxID=299618 RepID=UPI0013906197|nr:hypothetical protein [Nocardia lijiangensis]
MDVEEFWWCAQEIAKAAIMLVKESGAADNTDDRDRLLSGPQHQQSNEVLSGFLGVQ